MVYRTVQVSPVGTGVCGPDVMTEFSSSFQVLYWVHVQDGRLRGCGATVHGMPWMLVSYQLLCADAAAAVRAEGVAVWSASQAGGGMGQH